MYLPESQLERDTSLSQSAGTSQKGDSADAPALESLEEEIQVRLRALRNDAAAFLEEPGHADGFEEERDDSADVFASRLR
eukprot:Skav219999  [mRNA]  locus=scaffold947:77694:78739:+ [translate_table: standard]